MADTTQFIRRIGLLVGSGTGNLNDFNGINLSNMRIRFNVNAADVETPNNAIIRVYNLKPETVNLIQTQGEFTSVLLQAGYANGAFGVIFSGSLKQIRSGKEDATNTYLDLLCGDGDELYNQTVAAISAAAGTSLQQQQKLLSDKTGAPVNLVAVQDSVTANALLVGGTLPRGKVLFGMYRDLQRDIASKLGCSWSIQNGVVQLTPYTGVQPFPEVNLSTFTGLVGVPEQTDEGIKVDCLLNPQIRIGGPIVINNAVINQTIAGKGNIDQTFSGVPFNTNAGTPQLLASISNDGTYRVFCVEHEGDTRGQAWYSHVIMLKVDASTNTVQLPPQ